MSRHLQRALEHLRVQLLALGGLVEEAVWRSARAFQERDVAAAERVVAGDREVDDREVAVEEECLGILALHRPVAGDLRFIVAVLKITNDLERIGDLAVNIAQRALYLARLPEVEEPFDLAAPAALVQGMLHDSLQALVTRDPALARAVCRRDDAVDDRHRALHRRVRELVRERSEWYPGLIQVLSVSGHLERIGDLATNVAEDVIYMVDGVIVRHGHDRRVVENEEPPPVTG